MSGRMLFHGLAIGVTLSVTLGLMPRASALEPVRPEPQSAAKPCPRHGAGFIRIPGSDTCLRVGGRATTGLDIRSREDGAAARPIAGGRLAVDTRTESDYGPVRTYVRIDAGRR
ncbi:porin [Methylobacterium sp. 77]|uniref:porin n=1 Tax=Methylobacterium sp. 77 TaxID=1101192 RepID=UPI001FD94BC1|nr:porin [Methylobacterium sp. 77]